MKKIVRCDMHVHTNYSFDNSTPMALYPEIALLRGIDAVCFTDHIDCTPKFNTFDTFEFGKRAEEFYKLQAQYSGRVKLLLGFEVGEPHLHPDIMKFLYSLEPDLIIGSIHRPDHFEQPRNYTDFEFERLYDRYVREMVDAGGFDVLGHLDGPKRYHKNYVEDTEYIWKTLELCVERGIVPEINTSCLRNGGMEPQPSLAVIAHYRDCGGKYVTIGSDSHKETALGYDFDLMTSKLPEGLSTCYFEKRKLVPVDAE